MKTEAFSLSPPAWGIHLMPCDSFIGINVRMARGTYQLHLEKSFSAKDWQYLCQNGTFKGLLSISKNSIDDFEHLIEIATLLLQRRDDMDWIAAVHGIRSPYTLRQRMEILLCQAEPPKIAASDTTPQ